MIKSYTHKYIVKYTDSDKEITTFYYSASKEIADQYFKDLKVTNLIEYYKYVESYEY